MTALRPVHRNNSENGLFKLHTLSAVIIGLCVSGQAVAENNNNVDDATVFDMITVCGEKVERSI